MIPILDHAEKLAPSRAVHTHETITTRVRRVPCSVATIGICTACAGSRGLVENELGEPQRVPYGYAFRAGRDTKVAHMGLIRDGGIEETRHVPSR